MHASDPGSCTVLMVTPWTTRLAQLPNGAVWLTASPPAAGEHEDTFWILVTRYWNGAPAAGSGDG